MLTLIHSRGLTFIEGRLYVLESVMDSTMEYIMKLSCWTIYSKSHGLPKFALGPPLGGRFDETYGRPWNLIHSPPCKTSCRLFIHEVFFRPLGLHVRVWSELGRSPPFRPIRALRLQWSWAFSLVCEVALTIALVSSRSLHSIIWIRKCVLWD